MWIIGIAAEGPNAGKIELFITGGAFLESLQRRLVCSFLSIFGTGWLKETVETRLYLRNASVLQPNISIVQKQSNETC